MRVSSTQICKDLRDNRVNIVSEKMMDYLSLTLSSATELVITHEYKGTPDGDFNYSGVVDKLLINDRFYLVLKNIHFLLSGHATMGRMF